MALGVLFPGSLDVFDALGSVSPSVAVRFFPGKDSGGSRGECCEGSW